MLDALPKNILKNENAIVNLARESEDGTHWVTYEKVGSNVWYFDPIGNLQPPYELDKYWKKEIGVNIPKIIFFNGVMKQGIETKKQRIKRDLGNPRFLKALSLLLSTLNTYTLFITHAQLQTR